MATPSQSSTCGDVVRVDAVDVERDDPGAAVGRRPVEGDPGELAQAARARTRRARARAPRSRRDRRRSGSRPPRRAPPPRRSARCRPRTCAGSSPQVVSSSGTVRIMWPPRLNGSIASSSSARPQRAPTPLGPHILCPEKARKSQPSACTSIARCGAACAASTTMIAPCSCAHAASCSTGLIVPSEFETRFVGDDLHVAAPTRSRRARRARARRASSSGIMRKSAPVRLAMYCQGTKFEWCSSSVTTTTSPGPRLSSPHAYATRFSPRSRCA